MGLIPPIFSTNYESIEIVHEIGLVRGLVLVMNILLFLNHSLIHIKNVFFYIRNFLFILSVDLGMLPKGGKIAPLHGQRTNNPFITINCPQTIFSKKKY